MNCLIMRVRRRRVLTQVSSGKTRLSGLFPECPVDTKSRPPASQSDCSDAWSSRYSSPALENQPPQPALPFQRRMSVAGNQSFEFVSMNASQGRDEVSRRFSAPNIEMKCMPMSSDQGPILRTPPKPSNPPLKLYPWMTRKESPPKKTSIKCPYPTNDCVETLPKNMAVWRKHLAEKHGLARDSIPQTCLWPGCGRVMGGRSLNRHVVITHMDFKTNCPYCRERRRPDHLEKHIAKCPDNPARER